MHARSPSFRAALLALAALLNMAGCYALRPSNGGGQTDFTPPRQVNPADIALPAGFRIEPVLRGLTFPSAIVFDDANRAHVIEAGFSYNDVFTQPRLLRIEADGRTTVIARGTAAPWTGASFHQGAFYVSASGNPGRILRITPAGEVQTVVDGLPWHTDHFTDRPVPGPDGWLYFGQGTATNSAVVGVDNYKMGWLARHPELHDLPCRDIALTGKNFVTPNVLTADPKDQATTGAYVPFGTPTRAGQVIPGRIPCTGAIMRVRPPHGPVELVAWGLRHPYGLAFDPSGRLFVTDNGYDERGSRPVFGTADYLWAIKPGVWYGWPDFAGGRPLTDARFRSQGRQPGFVLADHPNAPPTPAAFLGVHSASSGFDFSRNPAFGYVGQAFIAQFGDMARQTGKVLFPVGFQVVRVDPQTGVMAPFATNKGKVNAPASFLNTGGLERPVDARFDRSGTALYIVDFGVMTIEAAGPRPRPGTGMVWRITRESRAP